jgi:hypothetical protein
MMKLARKLPWLDAKHKDFYSKIRKLGTWRRIQKILLCLWAYGMKDEGPLGSPFIGEPRCGQLANVGGQAANPCGQKLFNLSPRCGGWDKEEYSRRERREKRGEGSRPAINIWPGNHTCPPLNSHFHSSPYLVPLVLTPLTKSIKSKANSLHLFPTFYLFLKCF